MGYRLKRGEAEGRRCSDGHVHTFEKGKDYDLNEAQREAFASFTEQARPAKPVRREETK